MSKAPAPTYLGPAAHTMSGPNKPIHRIVLHSTVSPTVEGGARAIAAYFRSPAAGGSAHYVVDPGEVVQVVYDGVIAEHAPPNEFSLGIEMCDQPGKGAVALARWQDQPHRRLLRRTVHLTAALCLAYDVPAVFLTVDDLLAGRHGVTTHNNVSQAFHQSTHWDPGDWPEDLFMHRVTARIEKIKERRKP